MIRALINTRAVVTCSSKAGRDDAGIIPNGVLAWDENSVTWAGEREHFDDYVATLPACETIDAQGALVIPGLIDCHTHLAFGGWRAEEFARRCRGDSYLEIARSGGGIAATVAATRAASEESLLEKSAGHLREMAELGVTTVECKSGYGLTIADELKLLRVYRRLAERGPQRIVSTFLGAHVVPPEYRDRRVAYIKLVCQEMIPQVSRLGLAEFCDVFVEDGAFSAEEAELILSIGARHGLRAKLHVDQLHDGNGARLAARVGAISADHLEHASEDGIDALAAAGVVAVALPLASLYLRQPPLNARRFLDAGVDVAVASDFNPGTAPSCHLPLVMTLACTMSQLTPAEALRAATLNAARAIGREQDLGSLEPGKRADFALADAPSVEHLLYHFRARPIRATFVGGRCVAGGWS